MPSAEPLAHFLIFYLYLHLSKRGKNVRSLQALFPLIPRGPHSVSPTARTFDGSCWRFLSLSLIMAFNILIPLISQTMGLTPGRLWDRRLKDVQYIGFICSIVWCIGLFVSAPSVPGMCWEMLLRWGQKEQAKKDALCCQFSHLCKETWAVMLSHCSLQIPLSVSMSKLSITMFHLPLMQLLFIAERPTSFKTGYYALKSLGAYLNFCIYSYTSADASTSASRWAHRVMQKVCFALVLSPGQKQGVLQHSRRLGAGRQRHPWEGKYVTSGICRVCCGISVGLPPQSLSLLAMGVRI